MSFESLHTPAPRQTKPSQLRGRFEGTRLFGRPRDTARKLVLMGALGLALGVALFVGALFASMPNARATRVLGADNRIIGIPKNCDEARAARIAPMARGTGFYAERLDIDRNGLACEPGTWDILAKF
jgi:hypothetical protein